MSPPPLPPPKPATRRREAARALLDPGVWRHALNLVVFTAQDHVWPRRRLHLGRDVRLSPNTSLRNGERVWLGDRTHVGHHTQLWAGNTSGRIVLGADCLLGPYCLLTASNYGTSPDRPIASQPTNEADVVLGADVWLGAGTQVLPGVTIGAGTVVGAGSVVTRDLPAGAIAVGAPARVVGWRDPELAPGAAG